MIAREEVLKIARLARLHLSEDEVHTYQKHLTRVLDYISELKQVPTENEGIVRHVPVDAICLREDLAENFNNWQALIKNSPEIENSQFVVPTVVEHE